MLVSIFDSCDPRGEILSGDLSLDLFAAKLRLVVEGKAPLVYQSADLFFANTYPTDGIKTLIREVFSRLTGKGTGSPVIRLETSFGGGKTHDEIALWHICQQGRNIQGLEQLASVAWYLDYDPVTSLSRFKEEPSINKIITEEKEQVGRTQAKEDLRQRRDSIFAKKFFTLISNPEKVPLMWMIELMI